MTLPDSLLPARDAVMNRVKMLDAATQDKVALEHGYEMRVFGRCFALSVAFEELEHLLELLLKATTFEEISLHALAARSLEDLAQRCRDLHVFRLAP